MVSPHDTGDPEDRVCDTETTMDLTSQNCERLRRRGTAYQIAACLIANTSIFGPAMGLGYSAVALGPLSSPDSEIRLTPSERSWIASITAIAIPIGCILSSVSMRRGRRFAMMATSIVSSIGWLVIYLSRHVNHILVGRAISGVAMGLASVPATVYAAEISGPKLRGVVVTWTSVSIAFGILMVYIFGAIFQTNWRLVSLLCGLFPIISIILVAIKMPESPVWLRSVGRGIEAEEIWKKLNGLSIEGPAGGDGDRPTELSAENNTANKNAGDGEKDFYEDSREAFFTVKNFKPFFIMLGFFFFQQFSGIFVVIYYAVDFTLEAGVQMDGYLAAILIGFTRLFGTISVSYVSRKYGRRLPSIASGVGMTIFMVILSVYLWSKRMGYEVNDSGIIPVFSLLMYMLTSTMGFLVLPFAMIGELYPARVKDVFSGITTCVAYIFSFFVLKIYPDMLKAFDKHGVFLFYGIISFFGTIFVILFLPETKGRTLDEIQQSLIKKKLKKRQRIHSDIYKNNPATCTEATHTDQDPKNEQNVKFIVQS